MRSNTFQAFSRTLIFLNQTMNKDVMGTCFVLHSSWFAFPQLYWSSYKVLVKSLYIDRCTKFKFLQIAKKRAIKLVNDIDIS